MARQKKTAAGADTRLVGDKAEARRILDSRLRFNQALADRELDVIESVLAETATLVPGDDADLIQGRAAQMDAWKSIFSQMDEVGYVRSPQRIEIADDGHLAAESGRWQGGWTSEGLHIAYTGRYFAKWRLEGLDWKIESETFVTLKRTGGRA